MVIPLTYGRFGNFLFQVATAIGYARRYGLDFTVPSVPTHPPYPVYLPHLVNPKYDPSLPSVLVKEKVFHYHEIEFREEWRDKNIVLDGYWQSENYFKEFRSEILSLFGFKWRYQPGVISVHVRRGDYLKWRKKHPQVPEAWIDNAMSRFNGCHFVFFSDDIEWCQRMYGRRKDCSFSVGRNEIEDLQEMSSCEHHVCSASTFSWWGAWLNQNPGKKIIIPRLWFISGWGGHDTKDIVPDGWEKV